MDSVYRMAKEYYPKLWNKARLNALLATGKLTQAEYDAIVKEENTNGN